MIVDTCETLGNGMVIWSNDSIALHAAKDSYGSFFDKSLTHSNEGDLWLTTFQYVLPTWINKTIGKALE